MGSMKTLKRQRPSKPHRLTREGLTHIVYVVVLSLTPLFAKQPPKVHRSDTPLEYQETRVGAQGPVLSSTEIAQGAMLLGFSQAEGGLLLKGSGRGAFEIAGADHIWFPAEAHLVNGVLVVSTSLVQQPTAVRYRWSSLAAATLFNQAGVPAAPFNTDK